MFIDSRWIQLYLNVFVLITAGIYGCFSTDNNHVHSISSQLVAFGFLRASVWTLQPNISLLYIFYVTSRVVELDYRLGHATGIRFIVYSLSTFGCIVLVVMHLTMEAQRNTLVYSVIQYSLLVLAFLCDIGALLKCYIVTPRPEKRYSLFSYGFFCTSTVCFAAAIVFREYGTLFTWLAISILDLRHCSYMIPRKSSRSIQIRRESMFTGRLSQNPESRRLRQMFRAQVAQQYLPAPDEASSEPTVAQ
jgi:cytochrome c oxidase subunit IV